MDKLVKETRLISMRNGQPALRFQTEDNNVYVLPMPAWLIKKGVPERGEKVTEGSHTEEEEPAPEVEDEDKEQEQ
jgi:hypothetical protein